ncbi:glycerate kinase type-2 family protein [Deinococcus cavernae]|uniref:glycerate kinase type-2 family protein n=1 Tax=Deinococcus cavernae TaxID=2320857 RepID=UPI001F327B70|nr:glycerate kinase [Deinococcus cavernae]
MRADMRALLEGTYRAALAAVSPEILLAPHLGERRPDFILAFGKAALPMARAALRAYPGVPTLIVPPAATADLSAPPEATVMPGSHPLPDERSVAAAEEALHRLGALKDGQEALILVSGGGSALLAAPDGVTLVQKQALTSELLRAGADIGEINTVRRHLSRTKGGRLAQATRASVRALLLSDVVGDDLSVIASGPTVPDATNFADALAVLERYGIAAPEARTHFRSRAADTPDDLPNVTNTVVGSNRLLLEAAQRHLTGQGIPAVILGDTFEGEARELARFHASVVLSGQRYGSPFTPPVVLLSGGEATVTLRGDGVGGRNQEFALALALALGDGGVYALSAGSDGIDGSSEAAGAFLTPDTLTRARQLGLDARDFLNRNDSGRFFARLGDALLTGPSGHNLNDFRALALGTDFA